MRQYPGISPVKTGVPKSRKMVSMGHHLIGRNMTTHNNSLPNLVRGVGERVLFTDSQLTRPITAIPGVFRRRCESYRRTIVRALGRPLPVARVDFPSYYRGPRAELYARAVESLVLKPVQRPDSYLKTFVKSEKINPLNKEDPVPRVIQPRDPRYNVEVGRFLRPLEHRVYEEIDALFGSPTVFSPYNAYSQARLMRDKWDSFSNPVCIGLDASRFDQHVGVQALEFEHSLYNDVYKHSGLAKLLSWQIENVGFAASADGEFKYEVLGKRMSGDMNTSMGNKLLMCLMAKSYIDTKPFRIEFVNNGDDCLVITESDKLAEFHDLKDYFADFGFKIVSEDPVYDFERIEFCQTKPVCCNGMWRMVRNVKTCLAKDLTSITMGHRIDEYRVWLRDVGKCGLSIAADVPVMGAFYRMMDRLGATGPRNLAGVSEFTWYLQQSKGAHTKHTSPDPQGRLSYWLSTGLTPDEQEELESLFNGVGWGTDKRQLITRLDYLINNVH